MIVRARARRGYARGITASAGLFAATIAAAALLGCGVDAASSAGGTGGGRGDASGAGAGGGRVDASGGGGGGQVDASRVDAAPVPGVPITVSIDATDLGYTIPANYVGLSFSRKNIAGNGSIEALFDPTRDGNYSSLVNLVRQIGVKHIRTVSGTASASEPDPTAAADDAFFQFAHDAGLGKNSIIYSLHLFNEDPRHDPPPGTSNTVAAAHIWNTPADRELLESFALGNESDWKYNYRGQDPVITGYNSPPGAGYKEEWTYLYGLVQHAIGDPAAPAPFSGPDTGSNYPVETDSAANTSINGVPFTLRFAIDQHTRINMATQHFYGGSNTRAPSWAPGAFVVGDVVADPKHQAITYRCIRDDPHSKTHPGAAPTYWEAYPPLWKSGSTYHVGDEVQDASDPPHVYRCARNAAGRTTNPAADPSYWSRDGHFPLLSAHQMAVRMLSAAWQDDYQTLLDNALAGASDWPSGLRYRLTESNSFSGGRDPASQIFATALWALDYFHWWAQRGCAGIDPFTRVVQYNAPIYQDPATGDFRAVPYAYGMLAFAKGSHGTSIAPDGLAFSSAYNWLTGYAVVDASDLHVTLINKSFAAVGATDAAVTIAAPVGFAARRARYLVLASGPGASDALEKAAILGGATIPSRGDWQGEWKTIAVNPDGSVGPLPVGAASAVVVDLTNH